MCSYRDHFMAQDIIYTGPVTQTFCSGNSLGETKRLGWLPQQGRHHPSVNYCRESKSRMGKGLFFNQAVFGHMETTVKGQRGGETLPFPAWPAS